MDDPLDKSLDDLELSTRSYNALSREYGEGVTVRKLQGISDDEFLSIPNIGKRSLAEIRIVLDIEATEAQLAARPHALLTNADLYSLAEAVLGEVKRRTASKLEPDRQVAHG